MLLSVLGPETERERERERERETFSEKRTVAVICLFSTRYTALMSHVNLNE